MQNAELIYEPPTIKVYQFDESDKILTASSGNVNPSTSTSTPTTEAKQGNYAANALNQSMGGINTTIEK